jgi:translation initiation factor 2 beta subunit (eIF-2beta)/eIF-5
VRSEKGPVLIAELTETLRNLCDEDSSLLKASVAALDREEEEDNAMRVAHGSRWTRTPSHTITLTLRQEAAKYRGHIEHAAKSDGFIATKWKDHGGNIALLAGPMEELAARLPSTKSTGLVDTSSLKRALAELDSLIAVREALKRELSELSNKDDISKALLSGRAYEEVYTEELKKYDNLLEKLRNNYIRQEELFAVISQENEIFVMSRKDSASAGQQRERMLAQLFNAFTAYEEIKAGLREGIQFYTNLQEILHQFKGKCEDFKAARTTEKAELVAHVSAPPPASPPHPSAPQWGQPYMQPHVQPPPLYAQPPPAYGAPYGQPPSYPYGAPPPYGGTQRR